jgi:glycosyltransferase involved in cell wall biosynthesis
MHLLIVHYHLRPGGIRRIIETATPYLVAGAPQPVGRVILATGEAASAAWHRAFARSLAPVPVEVAVVPAFRYFSEQRATPGTVAKHIRQALHRLLGAGQPVVWIHNPAVGRNLLLGRELARACAEHEVPLLAHHHDWWFDNRWQRWPEIRRSGITTLAAAAAAAFPPAGQAVHLAINQADAAALARHCGRRAAWLPNLTDPEAAPSPARTRAAGRWLRDRCGIGPDPVWLVPCRTLRRKNLAEALLLTRWLRPAAWLLVTGAASSADELPYRRALARAAHRHHWRMRLGILAGSGTRQPTIAELLATAETVLFTSIQEGFGLPYLEAAAARRPLVARRLPDILPDLTLFGFRFPQSYDDLLIPPGLFDWPAERKRQALAFRRWRAALPAAVRKLAGTPQLLAASAPCPVAFSRLTLTAQIEVLAAPPDESWAACRPLNRQLAAWRQLAATGALRATRWPRTAGQWLSGPAYARRWHTAATAAAATPPSPVAAPALQADLIRHHLDPTNLYPLLWQSDL